MRLLRVTASLGPGVSPARLERLVRGIRVATDVGQDAELRQLRRTVTEQMKFPTDEELAEASERLSPAGGETGPRYRARQHLDTRRQFREELRGGPPEWWFDYYYRLRRRERSESPATMRFLSTGYGRVIDSGPFPILANTAGLDVIDPPLYQALVADTLSRLAPGGVGVRELRYENPFFQRLFGRGTAEKTISATAQVIETVATIGPTRTMAKADAAVANATIEHRIEASELDVERQRIALEREKQALIADQIRNERSLERLSIERMQRSLVEAALQAGRLDMADSIQALDPPDAAALGELAMQPLELEEHYGDDPPDRGTSEG